MAQPILPRILETKRQEIAQRSAEVPVDEMKQRAKDADRPRNFFQAVSVDRGKPLNLIAEIKKASPSAGIIREDFDPAALARAYEAGGADALSVLTDEQYFRGSLDYLRQAREATTLPVLRKDFIIDPYQVWEARANHADAILLIAEALAVNEMIDLQILATELRMTTLIEVHSMENLIRVRDTVIGFPHHAYSLIGINNRDLDTFHTSLSTSLRLADLIEDKSVLVSESGISTRDHVAKLADAGVRAMLVGESLMREPDVEQATRLLLA
ncbi:MAG: indole-3-glycerol phosphate synthase TrpC [Planctomycetota bacterium]